MDQVLVRIDTVALTSREDLRIVQPHLTLIRAGQHVWVCREIPCFLCIPKGASATKSCWVGRVLGGIQEFHQKSPFCTIHCRGYGQRQNTRDKSCQENVTDHVALVCLSDAPSCYRTVPVYVDDTTNDFSLKICLRFYLSIALAISEQKEV
jgi:hypothetical protein